MGDLGYQLTFSYFDEASVSEWRGCDLRLACDLPNIDLIVLPVRKARKQEGKCPYRPAAVNYVNQLNSIGGETYQYLLPQQVWGSLG